jgi:hypothetical protein
VREVLSEPRQAEAQPDSRHTNRTSRVQLYRILPSVHCSPLLSTCQTFARPKWEGGLPSWLIGPQDTTSNVGVGTSYQAIVEGVTVSGLSVGHPHPQILRYESSSTDLLPLFSLGTICISIPLRQPYHTSSPSSRTGCRFAMIGLPGMGVLRRGIRFV